MKKTSNILLRTGLSALLIIAFLLTGCYVLVRTVPAFQETFAKILPLEHEETEHSHEGESADAHAVKGPAMEISLSATAAKNIGIDDTTITKVKVVDYYKSLTFPATVVERPGISTMTVPSPVSGVITKIHHEAGVSVLPGEPLFDVLLNQQEMVKGQTDYLALLKKREINAAEIQRLSGIGPEMVPKQQRELTYEKKQIDQEINVLKNVLVLQGLKPEEIVETLEKKGMIIRDVTVYVPKMVEEEKNGADHTFTIDILNVTTGKNVEIGESLCQLSDYCELMIKAKVFATNESEVNEALENKSRVSVRFEGNSGSRTNIDGLVLRSVDNKIDGESGMLFCYVDLMNQFKTYEVAGKNGPRRFTQWFFKPGQRCELNVEYETLPNCIVLPIDAIAQDLNEVCVFELVGNEDDKNIWRKKTVHLLYRTKDVVAIANDGALFPETTIATKGASFILAALDAANQKSAGGGGGVQHGDHVH